MNTPIIQDALERIDTTPGKMTVQSTEQKTI